jgi:hypothetical protein
MPSESEVENAFITAVKNYNLDRNAANLQTLKSAAKEWQPLWEAKKKFLVAGRCFDYSPALEEIINSW